MAFGLHDDLPEDAAERASFDRAKNSLYGGRALAAIAAALTQMSKANPENGSLSKMLAIYANEVASADRYTQMLIDTYAKRGMYVPDKPTS